MRGNIYFDWYFMLKRYDTRPAPYNTIPRRDYWRNTASYAEKRAAQPIGYRYRLVVEHRKRPWRWPRNILFWASRRSISSHWFRFYIRDIAPTLIIMPLKTLFTPKLCHYLKHSFMRGVDAWASALSRHFRARFDEHSNITTGPP